MTDQPKGEKPALTVVIQSWWTPALAVLMLVVGLLAGYFGRPMLNSSLPTEAKVAVAVTPVVTSSTTQNANPTATTDPTQQAVLAQQMMASLIQQTTNFQGDPNATVTLIEFSDYQ